MAAVPITLIGAVTYDNGTTQNVTFNGVAALTGLGVGGGPAEPPLGIWGPTDPRPGHPIAPGGQPPGIWGPTDPRPQPPIYLPPVNPGEPPLVIWGPGDPRPQPPIHLPPPPDTEPAPPDAAVKPPPEGGGWAYVSAWGWGYFPAPGEAGPK